MKLKNALLNIDTPQSTLLPEPTIKKLIAGRSMSVIILFQYFVDVGLENYIISSSFQSIIYGPRVHEQCESIRFCSSLKFDSDWPAKKNRIYFILIRLPQWYFRARISIKCWMHCTIGRQNMAGQLIPQHINIILINNYSTYL